MSAMKCVAKVKQASQSVMQCRQRELKFWLQMFVRCQHTCTLSLVRFTFGSITFNLHLIFSYIHVRVWLWSWKNDEFSKKCRLSNPHTLLLLLLFRTIVCGVSESIDRVQTRNRHEIYLLHAILGESYILIAIGLICETSVFTWR